jgi:hypothetical protein
MRRAPQLWEQRLARTTAILGAGISSSGDATAIVPPSSPPGAGGGTEPAPVAPAPGLFIAPSAPTLIGSVQGINVVWNGLNSAGDLWPSDTSYVEVHMSTAGTGFTPDASTLKGRLARPGGLAVVGLTAGTTYHFRLRGADPAGNFTSAGAAASGTPGLINAPDIAANAITANSIVAGTITGWSINAAYLSGGTISGGLVSGGTVEGALIKSAASGQRVEIQSSQASFIDSSNTSCGLIYGSGGDLLVGGGPQLYLWGDTVSAGPTLGPFVEITSGTVTAKTFRPTADAIVYQGYRETSTAADVIMRLSSDVTSTNQAKFEVDADGDVKSRTNSYAGFSDARYKENVTPARDYLQDLRDVEVVTFNWEGSEQKLLGVTAQQIQPIFPNMVAEDEDGTLSVRYSVFVPMLITAVQSLATEVEDLRARIEALEA